MFSTKIIALTTMVLSVTKVVLRELIQNIKVVTFHSVSIIPSRFSEDSFESPPHTQDQAVCLLLLLYSIIADPTRTIRTGRVAAVIMQPILPNKMPRVWKALLRAIH